MWQAAFMWLSRPNVALVSRAAVQDEAAVAVTAFGIALFVDFQPDTRVSKRCRAEALTTNVACPIAANAGAVGIDRFRRLLHEQCR